MHYFWGNHSSDGSHCGNLFKKCRTRARYAVREERLGIRCTATTLYLLADKYGYHSLNGDPETHMIAYRKDDIRLNFWLTTGTVKSSVLHPGTQAPRKQQANPAVQTWCGLVGGESCFRNPADTYEQGLPRDAPQEAEDEVGYIY